MNVTPISTKEFLGMFLRNHLDGIPSTHCAQHNGGVVSQLLKLTPGYSFIWQPV